MSEQLNPGVTPENTGAETSVQTTVVEPTTETTTTPEPTIPQEELVTVPRAQLEAFQAYAEDGKASQTELQQTKDLLALYQAQANTHLSQVPQIPQPGEDNPFEGIEEQNLLPSEIKLKRAIEIVHKKQQSISQRSAASTANIMYLLNTEGAKEEIQKAEGAIKANPVYQQMIAMSTNQAQTAHEIAKMVNGTTAPETPEDPGAQLARILANQNQPGNPSTTQGGSAISAVNKIANMSDEDFARYKEQVKSGKVKVATF